MEDQDKGEVTGDSHDLPGLGDDEHRRAAELIQKTFRGHRERRQLKGFNLNASTRWHEAVKDAQYQEITRPHQPTDSSLNATTTSPTSPAKQHWRKVTQVAKRAGEDDDSQSVSESSDDDVNNTTSKTLSSEEREARQKRLSEARERRRKTAKMMDLQYFLEMVDHKHRHGSNLRKYHAHWKTQETNQSFFYWLDQGDGKDLDLEECSRERLDSMQVRYLSREERLNYLVNIDSDGLLVWAKNGERVWTKDELFKDSVKGIVPTNDATPAYKYNVAPEHQNSDDSSDSESSENNDSTKPDEGEEYINEGFHRAKGPAKLKHVSAAVLFNHMIRSSLKKGHKWIFVADTSFRLYIGYKQAGAFQHSSFLHGSRILAAGQIKVKRGQLRRLAPLSGHYRPPAKNFRSFVENLKEAGVDMSRVSISQSYAVLVGLEGYTKTRRRIKSTEAGIAHQKDKVLHPEKVKEEQQAKIDNSQSAKMEREYLEQQRLEKQRTAQEAKGDRGPGASIKRLFKRMTTKDEKDGNASEPTPTDGRGIPGSGPEDGIPPPEGKLIRH